MELIGQAAIFIVIAAVLVVGIIIGSAVTLYIIGGRLQKLDQKKLDNDNDGEE